MSKWALVGCCVGAMLLSGCSAGSDSETGSTANGAGKSAGEDPGLALGGTPQVTGGGTTSSAGTLSLGGSITTGDGGAGSGAAETCDGKLTGYVRDFSAATHPDFEPVDFTFPMRVSGKYLADEPGIIQATLGDDQKPVYAKGNGSTSATTTGSANFASWFHDTNGLNQGRELTLQFKQDPNDPDGNKWFYDSADTLGFFPIDGELLSAAAPKNEGLPHNYHFTFELHTVFKYRSGQVFRFRGDDDVWIFINQQLVVDLGGIHVAEEKTVDLAALGLVDEQEYPLDGFFAERHVTDSNFSMETSLEFVKCNVVVPR